MNLLPGEEVCGKLVYLPAIVAVFPDREYRVSPDAWVSKVCYNKSSGLKAVCSASAARGESKKTREGLGGEGRCYVARRVNPGVKGAPDDGGWLLYRATIAAAPANTAGATLLVQACAAQ